MKINYQLELILLRFLDFMLLLMLVGVELCMNKTYHLSQELLSIC